MIGAFSVIRQAIAKGRGSQMLNLQRDALPAAGVSGPNIYRDKASAKEDASAPGITPLIRFVLDLRRD